MFYLPLHYLCHLCKSSEDLNSNTSNHCHWYLWEKTSLPTLTLTLLSVSQECFFHRMASAPAFPVQSARLVFPRMPLVLALKTHNVNVASATSFWVNTACVHLALNALELARVLLGSVARRETRNARSVPRELFQRSVSAPNPAIPAPSAPTLRWRSDPACPTPTHCAWVSCKEELDY